MAEVKSANHSSQTWPFDPVEPIIFVAAAAAVVDDSEKKNMTVSWIFNFRVHMLLIDARASLKFFILFLIFNTVISFLTYYQGFICNFF